MARILLHYDISSTEARSAFQKKLTDGTVSPKFLKVTESVYWANLTTTEDNLNKLKASLCEAALELASGDRIFLEHPGTTNNRPDIIQTPIV